MQVFDYVIDDYSSSVSRHLCVLSPAVKNRYEHTRRHQTKREELLPIRCEQSFFCTLNLLFCTVFGLFYHQEKAHPHIILMYLH